MIGEIDFSNRTALVTGATTGIGRAIAQGLAERKAHVIINSEDAAGCDRTVAELEAAGFKATALPADLSRETEVQALADRAWEIGRLDCLFLNAGIAGGKRPGDKGYEEEVSTVFAVNLHQVRRLCDRLLPRIASAGGGAAVLTASLSALRGNRNIGVYSLTKAAVVQLARDMAVRWGPEGVRVNALAPGLIATGWEKAVLSDEAAAARRMQMTPLRRIGSPDEVASAALFLGSDAASFVTGHTLVVDGGTAITDGN